MMSLTIESSLPAVRSGSSTKPSLLLSPRPMFARLVCRFPVEVTEVAEVSAPLSCAEDVVVRVGALEPQELERKARGRRLGVCKDRRRPFEDLLQDALPYLFREPGFLAEGERCPGLYAARPERERLL